MQEGATVEVAKVLTESEPGHRRSDHHRAIEILEAVALALVAIATAWSGLQSARWDGRAALLYAESVETRVDAAGAATEGGQQRLLDVVTFNTWIQAVEAKDDKLAEICVRRFSAEYKVAFDAWLATRPFSNPTAPPGPTAMPEYENALLEKSRRWHDEAAKALGEGAHARETSERYVRSTVLLATILFLIAISQRFPSRSVRIGLLVLAAGLLAFTLGSLATYPRL